MGIQSDGRWGNPPKEPDDPRGTSIEGAIKRLNTREADQTSYERSMPDTQIMEETE